MKSETFISVIVPLDMECADPISNLQRIHDFFSSKFCDFELIVVDGTESTVINQALYKLTHVLSLTNTQCLVLDRGYDIDMLSCIGIHNAIGDYIAVCDLNTPNFDYLIDLNQWIENEYDVVYFITEKKYEFNLIYLIFEALFSIMFNVVNKNQRVIRRGNNRILSKVSATWLLSQRNCVLAYRSENKFSPLKSKTIITDHLIQNKGFKAYLLNFERATRILLTSSQNLLRYISVTMLLAAFFNVLYSLYAVFIAIGNPNVAPGWSSLTLQFSAMFFLFSIVIFVFSEYFAQYIPRFGGLTYQVVQNYVSKNILHGERPNVS